MTLCLTFGVHVQKQKNLEDENVQILDADIIPMGEIEYDLNYDGVITNRGNGTYSHPRGLYRYPITYDGLRINIIN